MKRESAHHASAQRRDWTPDFVGCLQSAISYFKSVNLCFKGPFGAAGQTPWIIISAREWGKEDRSLRWLLKRRASPDAIALRIYFTVSSFFLSLSLLFETDSLLHPNLIKVKYLWIRNRAGCCHRGMRGGGGQYEVCFFWKSRRKTDTEKVYWCAKACDALLSWEIIASREEMA